MARSRLFVSFFYLWNFLPSLTAAHHCNELKIVTVAHNCEGSANEQVYWRPVIDSRLITRACCGSNVEDGVRLGEGPGPIRLELCFYCCLPEDAS